MPVLSEMWLQRAINFSKVKKMLFGEYQNNFLLIVSERHSFSTFGRLLTTLQRQETEGLKDKGESQTQIQKMDRKYRIMQY
jgi:hypothetical protein